MADPKQLASLLSDEKELRKFNAMQGDQPWYSKALPMEGRATFLPFRDTMEGSVFNKRELALPGILAGALNAFTSPARAATGSDPTFNAGEEAANMALNTFGGGIATGKALKAPTGQGGIDLALNAYHGTPHNIKGGFDISKVGTGEGAQAYGHGMYFAENPAVAKEYQKMLAGPEQAAADYLKMYKTPDNAISVLQNSITPNLTAEAKKFALDAIDVLKSGKELKGNLYKVDIPDEQIPMMLDWDKPINEQPEKVKTAIQSTLDKFPKIDNFDLKKWTEAGPLASTWHNAIIRDLKVSDKELSKILNESGITGIRYLDEGSRASGKGTSNFVVFDPLTVKILEKNDQPVTRRELLQQEFNKLEK